MNLFNTGNAASVEIVNCIKKGGLRPDEDFLNQLALAVERIAERKATEIVNQTVGKPAYEIGEFYYFRNPHLRPGFEEADGRVLASAETRYPEAWAFLQTAEGKALCLTEAEWQAMSTATFATLADGTTVGWDGIGGVPFFVQDPASGSLRLPDLRGMYTEAAGFDSLGVGDVHGDGIRNFRGRLAMRGLQYNDSWYTLNHANSEGVFEAVEYGIINTPGFTNAGNSQPSYAATKFDPSLVIPTSNKNQPRAWGALACVYLGKPAA